MIDQNKRNFSKHTQETAGRRVAVCRGLGICTGLGLWGTANTKPMPSKHDATCVGQTL
ncbi:Uncharacterised protein [Mycobacterium tuberculosis]|uniref:Uncharacterized protein n=1 Tax=Mycobacterium tuberculosis TaxID=1773 RepID=A0A916LFH1_MYCTX|nr:Uncharacterised protein [Mycobacterium tuberculosis]CPA33720.1 Uncharacterised protein [Mycobacterium tuberculosis]CPA57758.1 Uncharacterised protein [Mycobacterium tuberculosis]